METLVKDLNTTELKELISSTVKSTIEDTFEDVLAKTSNDYLHLVMEAREDYKAGRTTKLEDLLDG